MAVIQYKCTVCKREVNLPENQDGLEVMNHCIITEGCRGELSQINRLQDFLRGDFPPRVPGLTDYTQRRVLFNHTQSVEATEWFIEHNLGVAPSIEVLVDIAAESEQEFEDTPCVLRTTSGNQDQIETTDFTVTIIDRNTLTITFTDPRSGIAQLVARSSAPKVVEDEEDDEIPVFQLTNDSLFSVATLNATIPENATVDFDIVYTPPGSTTSITESYTAGISATSESPWNDIGTALIDGKRYRVRSFDVFVSGMSDGTIPDGSSFYFNTVNGAALKDNEVIILLSLPPFANVDKVQNQLLDASSVDATNAELSLFHRDRELFAFTPVITSVFPPIREVS